MILVLTFKRPDNLTEKQAFGSSRCMLTQVHLTKVRYRLWLEFQGVFLWDFKIDLWKSIQWRSQNGRLFFSFWFLNSSKKFNIFFYLYRLSEELYQKNEETLNNIFRPFIERLINSLCRHCQMEPDYDGNIFFLTFPACF